MVHDSFANIKKYTKEEKTFPETEIYLSLFKQWCEKEIRDNLNDLHNNLNPDWDKSSLGMNNWGESKILPR